MYQKKPQTYASSAVCAGLSRNPLLSSPSIASNSGVRQNQQNSLRHEGTGPAIENGNTCNTDDKRASAHRRKGIDRIGFESSTGNLPYLAELFLNHSGGCSIVMELLKNLTNFEVLISKNGSHHANWICNINILPISFISPSKFISPKDRWM